MRYLFSLMFVLGAVISAPSMAQTAEQKALDIARQADKQDTGYVDERVDVDMILIHNSGKKLTRESHWRIKERRTDGDMRLYVFHSPEDQRGAAILSHGHIDRADDQWIYLPSLGRSLMISNENRSGSFVGSEFSYEDINSQEIPKFEWRYLREDTLRGRKVHVSERRPRDPFSGYSKQHLWVDQENLYTMRIESFDRKGTHFKTAEITGWKLLQGFWRQAKIEMTNHINKNVSILEFSNRSINTGLEAEEFSVEGFATGETLFTRGRGGK
ncbi:MAG: outer membrane lipoprotein-sorting protein [Ketobacteraceae bacterium]|nr:outer membrane lipoprotein-sorting protein [Ketobacteraceae bacterium]